MPKADTHASAAQAAADAAAKLVNVAADKARVAVDRQEDRFARTAAQAARDWKRKAAHDTD